MRPDGDVELQDAGKGFAIPPCESCGGILKPNVVFFGDGIPKDRASRYSQILLFSTHFAQACADDPAHYILSYTGRLIHSNNLAILPLGVKETEIVIISSAVK